MDIPHVSNRKKADVLGCPRKLANGLQVDCNRNPNILHL